MGNNNIKIKLNGFSLTSVLSYFITISLIFPSWDLCFDVVYFPDVLYGSGVGGVGFGADLPHSALRRSPDMDILNKTIACSWLCSNINIVIRCILIWKGRNGFSWYQCCGFGSVWTRFILDCRIRSHPYKKKQPKVIEKISKYRNLVIILQNRSEDPDQCQNVKIYKRVCSKICLK